MAKFDNSEYKRSHFKAPKGEGSWAFMPDNSDEWMFSPCMSFSEAKRWAEDRAPEAKSFMVGS